jgi:uncharacterized protein YigE (DUF2233 family)
MRLSHAGPSPPRQMILSVVLLLLAWLLLAGCRPAPAPTTSLPSPTPTVPGDSGWLQTEAGVEVRSLRILSHEEQPPLFVVRLDPSLVQFRVAYSPEQPTIMALWCDEHEVLAAINGGFFDEQYRATALVISNGETNGISYQEKGGMFAVDVEGNVSLRSLAEQPYCSDEPLAEAIQGWPMLINPGGMLSYSSPHDTKRARRSVIATDRGGRVLLMAFLSSSLTLHELAQWLHTSDLDIDAALNLDGGSSTGLCVNSGSAYRRIDSFGPLPLLLLAQRRE